MTFPLSLITNDRDSEHLQWHRDVFVPDEISVHDVFTPSLLVRVVNVLDVSVFRKFTVISAERCGRYITHEYHWIHATNWKPNLTVALEDNFIGFVGHFVVFTQHLHMPHCALFPSQFFNYFVKSN